MYSFQIRRFDEHLAPDHTLRYTIRGGAYTTCRDLELEAIKTFGLDHDKNYHEDRLIWDDLECYNAPLVTTWKAKTRAGELWLILHTPAIADILNL